MRRIRCWHGSRQPIADDLRKRKLCLSIVTARCPDRTTKERPILFSGPMVKALLAGTKTQTRRVMKPEPDFFTSDGAPARSTRDDRKLGRLGHLIACPYGVSGDRLWVRENGWQPKEPTLRELREGADTWPKYQYDADGLDEGDSEQFKAWGWKRRPSIHMPRWACRLVLEVTGVRVERLQEIGENDCYEEGVERPSGTRLGSDVTARDNACSKYRTIWLGINGPNSWGDNPWVWVIGFRRVES